ncbi:putative ABC-type transporter, permease component [Desulforapulum autotrophicum HRM2]|uniref:ABC-type transporter, permease component n=1 Tax=Desulforapulum autotrophicum (strain ATCC 43914 / DSM 3382 / VKM B-1955 / HRM2) TaxID=177437 RepID=C0QEB3_DESAH|nr:hypothetical protein [Desulforapulum autotrophicum]ACN13230.1 putative ABC-type transporter, permease component [Desulforapulum autotrophicum HRM2]
MEGAVFLGKRILILSGFPASWEGYLPAALPHGFTALCLNPGVSVAVLFFVESFATTEGLNRACSNGTKSVNAYFT